MIENHLLGNGLDIQSFDIQTEVLPPIVTEDEEMYKENIIDHYKHPHNHREITHATCVHREFNPLCGDEITLFLNINTDSIVDASFLGTGCAISQASASLLTDALKGMTMEQARDLTQEDITTFLGAPITQLRLKCALLPLKALHHALAKSYPR